MSVLKAKLTGHAHEPDGRIAAFPPLSGEGSVLVDAFGPPKYVIQPSDV